MLHEEALKVEDVMQMLGLSRNTVYALARSGELGSYRVGRKLFFSLSDVDEYLARGRKDRTATPDSEAAAPFFERTGDAVAIGGVSALASAVADRLVAQGDTVTTQPGDAYSALVKLYLGGLDAVAVDLYDRRTKSYNVPFVQRLAPGLPVVVYRFARATYGFAVREGSQDRLGDWSCLLRHDVRLANRPVMNTRRILVDEALLYMEAVPTNVSGYDSSYLTDERAIDAVRTGAADVAVVDSRSVEAVGGISFVPLHRQWMDFVVAKRPERAGFLRMMRRLAQDDAFKNACVALSSEPVESFGAVVYES